MSDKLDLTIGISADSTGVEAGVGKAKRSLKSLGQSAQGLSDELARAGREGGAGLDAIGKGGDRAAKQVEQAERSMRNSIQRQIAQMQAGSKTSREYWESLANQRGVNTAGLRSMLDQLEAVQRAQKKATESADGWGASLRGAGAAAAGLLVALSLREFVGKLVSVQREFDVLNASLVTVTGSAQAAATEFSWIKDFAKETPFGLKQATEAFVKMKSLGLDPTKASLTSFGNTASAMGKSLDQMIEAVADASTSEFERLKEFGIKASQSGETVAMTFQGVTKNIGNNAQEIVAYLESIGNHEFAKAMAERAKTLDGAIAELGDTWDEVFRTINENNTGSFIHDSVKLATGAIEDLNTIMRSLNEATSEGAQATGAFKTMQEGLAIVFETVAVVGLTVKDTLVGVGREIGAIAAQAAALARLDFKGFAAIGDMAKEDAKQARAEWESAVNAILTARQRVADAPPMTAAADAASNRQTVVDLNSIATAALNATKSYKSQAEQMAEVRAQGDKLRGALKQLEAGGEGASEEADQLRERLKGVDERLASMGKSGKTGASGVKSAESAILSYIKTLEARTAAQRLEIAQGEKLTESQRARIQLEGILGNAKTKASKSQIAYAQGLLQEAEANEAWLKNTSDVEKALADMQKAREQSLRSVQDSVRKLVEEAETTAYAEQQNISLAEAIERLALARAENAYLQAVERQESQQTLDFLRQEIEARKELVAATAQKGVKEANKKAAEQAAKDWEKVSQTIGDTLADYIMSGGKDAATYLQRLFSTLVLQPMVQTMVGGVMGTGAAAASGAGSSLNALSAGKGLWDAWSGSTGGMLASGVSALGSLTGSVFLGELGSAIAAGVELGISGAAALTGSASATTTAGMWLGAAAPWVAGIGALLSIVPSFLNGGTPHVGAAALYSGGGLSDYGAGYTSRTAVTRTYEEAMQKPVSAIVTSIGGALDAMAKAFGKHSGYSVSAGFSADNDDPSAALLSIADPAGNSSVYWTAGRFGALDTRRNSKFSSDAKEGFDQYLQSITAEVIPVFKGIVPGWADNLLTQLSDSLGVTQAIESGDPYAWQQMTVSGQEAFEALQTTLAQIAQIDAAFDALGKTMVVFADMTDDMKTALLGGLGGMEGFSAAAQTYYTAYYSEQERYTEALARMQEALAGIGVDVDPAMGSEAKAQYRALVESAFADGNEVLATQLLALSGAFAQTADAAQKVTDATQAQAQALTQGTIDLLSRLPGGAANARDGQAAVLAQQASAILGGMDVAALQSTILSVNSQELEAYLREAWAAADTVGAKQAVVDFGLAVMDFFDDVMRDLLTERKQLEAEMLRASGDDAGYAKALRAIATEGYTEAEIAAWDYNESLRAQINALDAATQAQEQAASNQMAIARQVVDGQRQLAMDAAAAVREQISDVKNRIKEIEAESDWVRAQAGMSYGQAGAGAADKFTASLYSVYEGYAANMGALAKQYEGMAQAQKDMLTELESEESRHKGTVQRLEAILAEGKSQVAQLMTIETAIGVLQSAVVGAISDSVAATTVQQPSPPVATKPVGWVGGSLRETDIVRMLSTVVKNDWGEAIYGDIIREYGEKFGDDIAKFLRFYDPAIMQAYERIIGKPPGGADTGAPSDTEQAATPELTIADYKQLAQLQQQYWQLLGDEESIRRAVLDTMHPQLRLVQQQVWAQEDQNRIAQERSGLEQQLLQLQGDTAALRQLELDALDPSNRALQERIWMLQEEQRITQERSGLMTGLYQALGNTAALRAQELEGLDPSNRALKQQVWQIEDAKSALEKALQAERDSANAAQQAAQERVSTIQSIFDLLKSNVQDLYETVSDATKRLTAAQANAFIDNALANARATGYLPEGDDLSDAIAGARAGLDKEYYATEFDKQRDTLVLAGKLSELQDISGGQLTTAERQLKAAQAQVDALDGLQKQGQEMLDSLSGNTTAVLSIGDAIANLSDAVMAALATANQYQAAKAPTAAVASATSSAAQVSGGPVSNSALERYVAQQQAAMPTFGSSSLMQSAIAAKAAEDRIKRIRGFAAGGLHAGGLRIVGENGPELEATGPSRIWNAQQLGRALTWSNSARLEALVEGLTAEVQRLQSIVARGVDHQRETAEILDNVTEGGNAMRAEVMA